MRLVGRELDLAMLRRLEKRVYVPLPGPEARGARVCVLFSLFLSCNRASSPSPFAELMLRKKLPQVPPSGPTLSTHAALDVDFSEVARRLEGYSGSDIALLCKEAAMRPVRRLMDKLEAMESVAASAKGGRAPLVSPTVGTDSLKIDAVTREDVDEALIVTKPSARVVAPRYMEWEAEFAST